MEMASIIINAGIFVATVIAAIIAHRSVVDSRDARDAAAESERKAEKAREDAVAAATRSATASERSASALERQVELAEIATQTPAWTVTEAHSARRRWKFQNTSGARFSKVSITIAQRNLWTLETVIPDPIAAGQSFFINAKQFGSFPSAIHLEWIDSDGETHWDDFAIA